MAVEYEVRASSGTIQEFEALITAWAAAYAQKTGGQVQVTPLIQPDRFYLFGAGSIRGLTLTPSTSFFKGGRVDARLNVLSSRADWGLGFFVLESLVREQRAAVFDESGRKLHLSELSPVRARQRAQDALQADLRYLNHFFEDQGQPFLRLSNLPFDLLVTRAENAAWNSSEPNLDEFERVLSSRAARLAFCRHASLVMLNDGLSANAIGFDPAIYPASDYAVLSKSSSPPPPGQPGELRYVKFGDFLDAFREKIERVRENPPGYYLPGIDLADPDDLEAYTRLLEFSQDELHRKS